MKPDVLIAVAIACAAHCFAHGASKAADAPRAAIVSRDIGDPEANRWEEGEWPTTAGEISILDERPDAPAAPKGHKALHLTIHYAPPPCPSRSPAHTRSARRRPDSPTHTNANTATP